VIGTNKYLLARNTGLLPSPSYFGFIQIDSSAIDMPVSHAKSCRNGVFYLVRR
jgi:hypothetical protein